MSSGTDKALNEFLSEAQEIVETLNRNLLALDEQRAAGRMSDPELINDSFRAVHSLKGLSGLFGLTQTSDLAHTLENLLDAIRLGKLHPRPDTFDLLFEAVELFGRALAAAADGGDLEHAQVADYLSRLQVASAPEAPEEVDDDGFGGYQFEASLLSVLTEYEEHRLRENIRMGAVIYRLNGKFDLMAIDKGIESIKERVKPVGEILTYLPSGEGTDPSTLELDILVASHEPLKKLREVVEGTSVTVDPVPRSGREPDRTAAPATRTPTRARPPEPVQAPASARRASPTAQESSPSRAEPRQEVAEEMTTLRSVSQTVRVDIRKLDALMNAVGELGLVHTGLLSLLERIATSKLVEETQTLRHEVRSLERKLTELQNGILEVRMVPLRQVFDKLSRVVRKVSRSMNKQIRLDISGADTELDKLIVEELSDPLMHIIRNSIDHGIESEVERVSAGKPEVGTISVRAMQQGNRVIVSVADDGHGIDEKAIAETATRLGLVDEASIQEMSRRDLLNLLFLPGMSTREEATEISGRGVGLDVVKTNIANLSGIIDVSSTPGVGTQVTMTLPITLAIIQAIIVRVAGRTYALPLNGVVESLMITPSEIRTIEGREVISLRRQTLRLARVKDIFRLRDLAPSDGAVPPTGSRGVELPGGFPADALPSTSPDGEPYLYVVVVGIAQHRLGLVVDELVGQQDIVIKPLGRALSSLRGVAGATELGGQKTVLVLDVPGMVEAALARGGTAEAA